jgi:hypothetical protein
MGLFDFLKPNQNRKNSNNAAPEYFDLPYFGQLNINALEDYYECSTSLNGRNIDLDLNFENSSVIKIKMEAVKSVLENLEKFDKQNKVYIENDYINEEGDTVRSYLENHLEQFDEDELNLLIDRTDTLNSPEKQLLQKITLVRLGLYPDNDSYFTTFDYSIGKDLTQYLIVITTDEDGKLNYLTTES